MTVAQIKRIKGRDLPSPDCVVKNQPVDYIVIINNHNNKNSNYNNNNNNNNNNN